MKHKWNWGPLLYFCLEEREKRKKNALMGHRHVHDSRLTKRAALEGRSRGGALIETLVAHFRRSENRSCATLTGHEVEYCWARVLHAPTVFWKKIIKNNGQSSIYLCAWVINFFLLGVISVFNHFQKYIKNKKVWMDRTEPNQTEMCNYRGVPPCISCFLSFSRDKTAILLCKIEKN